MAKLKFTLTPVTVLLITFLVLAIATILYYLLTHREKFEQVKLTVMLFYADWCPHCQSYNASGKYEEFGNRISKAYPGVVFEKYDYDKNTAKGDQYKVTSFPTIVAEDANGKVYRFPDKKNRESFDDMEEFVKSALNAL